MAIATAVTSSLASFGTNTLTAKKENISEDPLLRNPTSQALLAASLFLSFWKSKLNKFRAGVFGFLFPIVIA